MTQLPAALIGDAYRNGTAWETLESLVDVGSRMAGQDGEREAADVVASAFEDAGLRDVTMDPFEVPGWWRKGTTLSLPGHGQRYGDPHQLFALPGTPAGEPETEIVDAGHGTPEEFDEADVEGALAMASSRTPEEYDGWIHRREKYQEAADRGAVGFLFRNHVEGCLPPTGGVAEDDGPGPIPAAGLSRELGHRLVRYCERGEVAAALSIDCRNETTTSQNVSGRIGPETDEEVLVTAHYDAHDIAEGAEDNGAGSALVAEVGRLLAALEDDLEVGVRCITFGAEEMGLRGSSHMVETADLDGIKAVVNLDSIGGSRELAVDVHEFDGLADVFEAAGEELAVPVEINRDFVMHSDHWPFVREGVPGVMARSVTDDEGRGWGHTHADTLDKLDRRDFRDLAVLVTAGVAKLATEAYPVEAVDRETVEQRVEERGQEME
jgi:aminopeptidase YwaD